MANANALAEKTIAQSIEISAYIMEEVCRAAELYGRFFAKQVNLARGAVPMFAGSYLS